MQQGDTQEASKNLLVLVDFRSTVLPFSSLVPVKVLLAEIATVGHPVIAANHPSYISSIYSSLNRAGFGETEKKDDKEKTTVIISSDGNVQRTQNTAILIAAAAEKYGAGKKPYVWAENPKEPYPSVVILAEQNGFPTPESFKLAAVEYGYPLARMIYIAAPHFEGSLRNAEQAGVCSVVADTRTDDSNKTNVLYRPLSSSNRELRRLQEVIKVMAIPA